MNTDKQTIQGDDLSDLNFNVDISSPDPEALAQGFNQFGVKDTEDRVEFIFEAMQPGMRNGVKITEDFLQRVASNFEDGAPAQIDHDRSMLMNAGQIERVWFSDGALRLKGYIPKTGADTHQEFVNRFTFDPPQVQNGSVGFGMKYELSEDDDGNPMLVDGDMQEFSFLPFPGGYDESSGGLKAQFEEAYQEYREDMEPDQDELDTVYSEWSSMVNMDNDQMERWDENPCADEMVDGGEDTRDETLMLMGSPKESWSQQNVDIANQVIDFLATEVEKDADNPEEGGPGTCPSRWAVNLLNRGYNPFDDFPTGNPQFGESGTIDDDASKDDVSGVESFDVRLETETLHNSTTMTFERIDFDDLSDDLPEDVAEFISDVQEQHEANVEFIESVIEDRDTAEDELQEYKQDLAEDLEDREAVLFEADELVEFEMSRLHKLDADSKEFEVSADEADTEGTEDGDFGSKDRKSKNFTEDKPDSRATEGLADMAGISIE
jgi:hypothetical protein